MTQAPYNRNELLDRLDGDEEILEEVLAIFMEDIDIQINEFKSLIMTDDHQAIRKCAHTVKGVLINISAKQSSDIAYDIEQAAEKNDLHTARMMFEAFLPAVTKLINYLKENN